MHDIFFFTDIHGQKDLFHSMYDWCMRQDPECMIIYGGDACDRGDYGYDIMCELLDLPNVIYLKGNHEDMFVQACDTIIGHYACDDEMYNYLHKIHTQDEANTILHAIQNETITLACWNGGHPTLTAWIRNGADEEFVERIRNLPLTFQTDTVDFCHSAYSPNAFNDVAQAEYNNIVPNHWAADGLLWDRHSLNYGWTTGRYVVFGHTPTVNLHTKIHHGMQEDNIRPCAWQSLIPSDREKRNGWKIDMDTGATWTGRAYVLNALTMQVYGFYDPMVSNPHQESRPIEEVFEKYKII